MSQLKLAILVSMFVVVAGSLLSVGAWAGDKPARGPIPFAEFDQDGSGFVSEEEFNAVRGARMAANAEAGRMMRGAATAPAFTDIDTDNDGKLDADELAAGHKAHMEKMGGMKHQHAAGQGHGHVAGTGHAKGKGHKGEHKANMPMFEDFDLNADGKIVEDEFNEVHAAKMADMAAQGRHMKHAGTAPGFSGIDSNGDAEISKEEFSAHKAQRHKERHDQHQ